jgi:branched-chain amino acid transport system ATP-binding protein
VSLSLRIAHRAYLLETGVVVRSDDASKLLEDEGFRSAMLGAGHVG